MTNREVALRELTLVSNMNSAFQNPKGDLQSINWPRIQSQLKNVRDEYNELNTALNKDIPDFIGVRDALVDQKVFIYGAVHLMGYPFDAFANTVDEYSQVDLGAAGSTLTEVIKNYSAHCQGYVGKLESAAAEAHLEDVVVSLAQTVGFITYIQEQVLRVDVVKEMESVINGVMTRFIKDEADEAATYAKHNKKHLSVLGEGANALQVYYEGQYPSRIMKSAVDQPDAPKGKFLKSASFSEPVFTEYEHLAF